MNDETPVDPTTNDDSPNDGADIAPDRVIGLDLPVVPDSLDREDALLSDEERDIPEDDRPPGRRKSPLLGR